MMAEPMDSAPQLQPVPDGLETRLLTASVLRAQLLRLALKGLNAKAAAQVVGCSPETARMHYRDADFRRAVMQKINQAFEDVDAAFAIKKKTLHEMLEDQAYESCKSLIELLETEDLHPSLKVRIHQDFLNRVEESAQTAKVVKVDPTELRHAAKVAQEMDNVVPFRKDKTA